MRAATRSWWHRPVRTGLALFLLLVLLTLSARADLIFLKDGVVLQGQVKRESVTELDPITHEAIIIPTGFFYIDDIPRRIYFSPSLVKLVDKTTLAAEEKVVMNKASLIVNPKVVPAIEDIVEAGNFDDKWERIFRFRSPMGGVAVRQRLAMLTPYYARVDSTTTYPWSAAYLTREFTPDMVQSLLTHHPQFKESRELSQAELAARRFRYCDFFAQAGWYAEAETELRRILDDMPQQKERAESALAVVAKLKARERFEDVKRMHQAGRYKALLRAIETFPEKDANEKTVSEIHELKNDVELRLDRLKEAVRLMDELAKNVNDGHRQQLQAIVGVLRSELHPDGMARLEPFLDQARQAQRQHKAGQTPSLDPSQLLALAVTGWLLGSPAAESKPVRALHLWRGREMALEYLKASGQGQRQQLLAGYPSAQAVSVDDMVQMIPQLPPVEPADNVGSAPIERLVGSGAGAASYLVQLPPEYHPGRAYPVLVVLHQGGEKPLTMLRRWSEAAADNGYILVAPSWEHGIAPGYGYSDQEHADVVQTLWDLKRRYKVDSDRVFLFGCGQGGQMAYDVGLSHPDLFAGVIPMGAGPEYFSKSYFRNGQALPFYLINGDRHGDPNKNTREQMDQWVRRGYPMIWVQYKGRGCDWFGGEVANVFDWMRVKKRVVPMQQLGTDGFRTASGNEFMTMRQSDNHFYWLSTAQVSDGCLNSRAGWNGSVQPAMLFARIDPQNNDILLKTSGLRQVTVWLGRNAQGQNMVDFTKPVTVRILAKQLHRKIVTPNLETLLEDLYQRGDRQLLFLGRIDLSF